MPDTPSAADARPQQSPVEQLKDRIEVTLRYTQGRRKGHQRWAAAIRVRSVALSGAATIILGLEDLSTWAGLAFSFTALVTLLGALEPFFNFRGIWLILEDGQAKTHRLEDDLNFYLAESRETGPDPERLRMFHDRLQRIWQDMSDAWNNQRRSGGPQG